MPVPILFFTATFQHQPGIRTISANSVSRAIHTMRVDVQGSLKGGGNSWTPAVYSRTQQEAVLSFYRCAWLLALIPLSSHQDHRMQ